MVRRIPTGTCHGRDGLNVRSQENHNVSDQLFGISSHRSCTSIGLTGASPSNHRLSWPTPLALNTGLYWLRQNCIPEKSLALCLSATNLQLLRLHLWLTTYQDPSCRRPLQLGVYLVPTMVQEVPQLPSRMVDSNHMAGFSGRYCICCGNLSARASDIELPKLRLSKMAWNASILCCSGVCSVCQHLSWSSSPTNRIHDAPISRLWILRDSNPTGLSSSSSTSSRGLHHILESG